MKNRKRAIAIEETLKEQATATRETKLFKLSKWCEPFTITILWVTAFGYLVGIGMTTLYMLS